MDTVKSVGYRHSHLWLCITENSVLGVGKTQLAISSECITAVITSRQGASTTTQTIRVRKVGWSDRGKSHRKSRSLDQMGQSYFYKMMVESAFSWKVSNIWRSKSRAESVATLRSSSSRRINYPLQHSASHTHHAVERRRVGRWRNDVVQGSSVW